MTNSEQRPRDDTQGMSDLMAGVYEAIATLEHGGRDASLDSLTAATGLSADALDGALTTMTQRGLLTVRDDAAGPVYVPARRGWSAKPDQARGQQARQTG